MSADKNDKKDRKPDYSLIPRALLDHLAYAMMAGEEKYGRYNYTKGHRISQLTAAAVRHLKAIESGEDYDADTSDRIGLSVHHAGNVAACMLMLLHQQELGTLVDDRFKSTKSADSHRVDEYDVVRTPGGGKIYFHDNKKAGDT